MGRRAGKYKKKENNDSKKKTMYHDEDNDDMMNDQIDAFHKQRDIVPLDLDEDVGESDADFEHPVLDFEDEKYDMDDNEEDDDDDIEDDSQLTGFAVKLLRQQKYLRAKTGGVEEEMDDDAEKEEEKERAVWGRAKSTFYDADNTDYEIQSSDEELPAEEEEEVLRLQKEKAKSLTEEDFGLEDVTDNEGDKERTFEEILVHGKPACEPYASKEGKEDNATVYEEVKKDINALTREEQMDVLNSSAPELVGLLSELDDVLGQLENKVNPLLSQIRDVKNAIKGGMHYMEIKQQLLLSYCQAIAFYLLLKSEGQPVRDHPVISRLVEIKNLLDKMKELGDNLPPELQDILDKNEPALRVEKLVQENVAANFVSCSEVHKPTAVPVEIVEKPGAHEGAPLVEEDSFKEYKVMKSKSRQQDDQVGKQSMEMLKVRAALEEKLKQKGIFSSIANKHDRDKKCPRPVNGQLETLEDFDDDAIVLEKVHHRTDLRNGSLLHPLKPCKLVASQANKLKFSGGCIRHMEPESFLVLDASSMRMAPEVVSGDDDLDDLPKRDDIGERRQKHELRVLAGTGIGTVDDVDDESGTLVNEGVPEVDLDGETELDLEFYKQAELKHAAKLAAKAEMHTRSTKLTPLPETVVDGKRQISYQMEKNRGLTCARKKLTKNPRKKYKLKHQKAVVRRKGQVRDIRKPTAIYGGEASGINAAISRSIRFKS
ncbi:LOW QUALITY PROTEIN: protein THALLO [Coffea arabica]|uniref:LOW QUALITY PROTEIN: protein THALLO n=1 Tax=Coffea arabica TaxID=13443 RepID=A0ABM4VQD3_COFAR